MLAKKGTRMHNEPVVRVRTEERTICHQGVKIVVERFRFEVSCHEKTEVNEQDIVRELRRWIKQQKQSLD